jgi:hypothetical protein
MMVAALIMGAVDSYSSDQRQVIARNTATRCATSDRCHARQAAAPIAGSSSSLSRNGARPDRPRSEPTGIP